MKTILHVNSSVRTSGSISREIGSLLVGRLMEKYPNSVVTTRDTQEECEFLTNEWVDASFTQADKRSDAQNAQLALSNRLAKEVLETDILVLGVSMYNFGLPSTLKAWIDQIARPGITFRSDPDMGYIGLVTGTTAYVVIATGETPVGGEMDYISGYIGHVLGFLGIQDVHVVAADMTVNEPETVPQRAKYQIDDLLKHSL